MYEICKFCGASSTTSDRCSNCGAPIEKLDEGPILYENKRIRAAIDQHYEEVSRRGFVISSGKNETLTTTIYIDDKKSFVIISSNGMIGNYHVYALNQDLTVAITNLSKHKEVLLPGHSKIFGENKDELVATISELLVTMDSNFSDSRIRIESIATKNLHIIPVSIVLSAIIGVLLDCTGSYRGYELGSCALIFAGLYMLLAPLHSKKGEHYYRLELITKVVSVLYFGIVVCILLYYHDTFFFVVHNYNDYYKETDWSEGALLIGGCFLVVAIYSFIQTFIIQQKKVYKYHAMLLIPLISIIFTISDDVFHDDKPFIYLMALMAIQTILLSIVNKKKERLKHY